MLQQPQTHNKAGKAPALAGIPVLIHTFTISPTLVFAFEHVSMRLSMTISTAAHELPLGLLIYRYDIRKRIKFVILLCDVKILFLRDA